MDKNPLSKWFRQPGIYIKLPSQGKYNVPGIIDFAAGDEVPVYPMTAADEIIATNPDSLLNGKALERIITSCCPSIHDAQDVVVPDADVLILATKLVSYGDTLALQSVCPKCDTKTDFRLSIRFLLDEAKPLPPEHTVRLNDDLVVYLRPYTLDSNNRINLAQFEESKRIQHVTDDSVSELERSQVISAAFQRITTLNLDLLANSILKIAMPGQEVSDQTMIREFIANASRDIVKLIKDGTDVFNKYGLPKMTHVTCSNKECNNEYEVPVVYDPSSFFVSGS